MKKRLAPTPKPATTSSGESKATTELPTFLDHVHELRRRLFWVVAIILLASAAAYPFLDGVISILTAPLGSQQLYYLTPIGGFSFSIKLCAYVGIIVGVPFIMYHLYRYLEPLMGSWRKPAIFYVGISSLLALGGMLFAYFVSLPAALHFLTGLNLNNIQAMLTVDSYLTFVMTYLLGAALLFQIPLLLMVINTMTPLKPGGLMKLQRFVIVGAFIVAAIISPTPDILNQAMFAIPIIGMYQLGIILVWLQNRARARRAERLTAVKPTASVQPQPVLQPLSMPMSKEAPSTAIAAPVRRPALQIDGMRSPVTPDVVKKTTQSTVQSGGRQGVYVDGMLRPSRHGRPRQPVAAHAGSPRPARPAPRSLRVPPRSIDGFRVVAPATSA